MKINHLIIGCLNLKKSEVFYCEVLGFEFISTFIDTGTKQEGIILANGKKETEIELLLVQFNDERLPSPQHIAFEVNSNIFELTYNIALQKNMDIRAMPPLDCKIKNIGITEVRGNKFERFYLLDPSGINIEIMRRC